MGVDGVGAAIGAQQPEHLVAGEVSRAQAVGQYLSRTRKSRHGVEITRVNQEGGGNEEAEGPEDELFAQALEIVTDMGRASTSVLQRRLSIGYGRAAKILDMMERRGFIGPSEGASKPRKVLQAAYDFRDRLGQILEEEDE